jgi:hypothetical protein
MPAFFDSWANLPGQGAAFETFAASYCWGPAQIIVVTPAVIAAGAVDSGNSPTYELRQGLLLGQITATSQWTNYSPTATDGSQVAAGILTTAIREQNVQGTTQQSFCGVMVGGGVIAANIIGLDQQARQQMRGKFIFDDDFPGQAWYPYKAQTAKTGNYTIVAGDNNTEFTTLGAGGSVTFTLPAIGPGYNFGFLALANQNMVITSAEGSNMVQPTAGNTLTGGTLTFSTGSQKIGSTARLRTNPAGNIWIVDNLGPNTQSWS